ncbi:DUF4955 domain-containing protein [Vibrio sp. E150_011]
MKRKVILLTSVLVLAACKDSNSQYWHDFVSSRDQQTGLLDASSNIPTEKILTDYSYAGFKQSDAPLPPPSPVSSNAHYQVFNVQDFGALPDDGQSDKQAIKEAIAAIKSARHSQNNSNLMDVLYFPRGTYIINDASDDAQINPGNTDDIKYKQPIFIDLDHIVVKGDGIGNTLLKMETHLQPENPSKKWTTPHMLQLGSRVSDKVFTQKVIVESTIKGGSTHSIQIEDAQNYAIGDSIELTSLITRDRAINDAISPYLIEYKASSPATPIWNNLVKGLDKREKHTITAINGNTINFATPIAHTLNSEDNWQMSKITSYGYVGIEDMTIAGNWQDEFVHHHDAVHDSGYSLLALNRVHNSWIRNVELKDFNQGGVLWNTFNVTAKNIQLSGTPGHLAFTIMYGNNNLIEGINDNSDAWHAPGVSKYSISNVYKDSHYGPDSSIDLHGEQSMNNLFDNMKGGWIYGRWGASSGNQPNHLKGLTFWNPVNTAPASDAFMFMKDDGIYGRVIMPYIIGMTGSEFSVAPRSKYINAMIERGTAAYTEVPQDTEKQAYLESLGAPVRPASLFEAQWLLRHQE